MRKTWKAALGSLVLAVGLMMSQGVVFGASTADETVSLVPGANNAYVVFGETIQSNKMTFVDGHDQGITDSDDPLYSEDFEMDNIKGRKVYRPNYVYFNIDKDFYQKGDNRFMVLITFYDFGPDVGYFYLEYNSTDSDYKSVSIMKPGITPKWTTQRIYLNDVDFRGAQEFGADMRIRSNAYNAFAKVELINVAALERSGGEEADLELPTVAGPYEEALKIVGLYDGVDEQGTAIGLEQQITRGEAIQEIIKATGNASKAKSAEPSASFVDVTDEDLAKALTVAEELGLVSVPEDKKFNPDAAATPRELMTFYLRYLHCNDENIYENAPALATQIALQYDTDFIIYIDRPAIRDHFVSLTYHMLSCRDYKTNEFISSALVQNGTIKLEDLRAAGTPEMAAVEYMIPQKVPKQLIDDPETGWKYWLVSMPETKMIRPYVTQQHFNYDGTKFIFGSDKTNCMYEYDIETEMVRFLDFTQGCSSSLNAHVTPSNQIYYQKNGQTWKMDWATYKTEKVSDNFFGVLNVTNDGTWMSGYGSGVQRYNLVTGKMESRQKTWPENPNSAGVGHPQINPEYPNLVFFCHEGTTTLIPDRLWMMDFDKDKMWNFFIQAPPTVPISEGLWTGETSGHEVWGIDGEKLYWVKYTYANNRGQSGLMRMVKEGETFGENREYINGDYHYWHCYPSADNNWVAGDTNDKGRIVVVDTRTQQSYWIASFRMINPTHPYQPHPNINYGGGMVSWQMVDSSNQLGVGFADFSNLVENEPEGGRMEYNDDITLISYKGAKSECSIESYANVDHCIVASKKNTIYCDINDETAKKMGNNLKLEITYYDQGVIPITINYTSKIETEEDLANMLDSKYVIPKTGTKTWKTVTVDINDALLTGRGNLGSDFTISSSPMSMTAIRDIKVLY